MKTLIRGGEQSEEGCLGHVSGGVWREVGSGVCLWSTPPPLSVTAGPFLLGPKWGRISRAPWVEGSGLLD